MRSKRLWIVLGAMAVVVVVGWTAVAAAAYTFGGVLTVDVVDRSEGVNIHLPVPMALVDVALSRVAFPAVASAGFGAFDAHDLELDLGIGGEIDLRELSPVILDLLRELDELPDMTLVEVVDRGDYVRISKVDGRLVVEVDEPDASVEVTVPMRGVLRIAERILD